MSCNWVLDNIAKDNVESLEEVFQIDKKFIIDENIFILLDYLRQTY